MESTAIWTVPRYIADGLCWLENRLCGPQAIEAEIVEGQVATA